MKKLSYSAIALSSLLILCQSAQRNITIIGKLITYKSDRTICDGESNDINDISSCTFTYDDTKYIKRELWIIGDSKVDSVIWYGNSMGPYPMNYDEYKKNFSNISNPYLPRKYKIAFKLNQTIKDGNQEVRITKIDSVRKLIIAEVNDQTYFYIISD